MGIISWIIVTLIIIIAVFIIFDPLNSSLKINKNNTNMNTAPELQKIIDQLQEENEELKRKIDSYLRNDRKR